MEQVAAPAPGETQTVTETPSNIPVKPAETTETTVSTPAPPAAPAPVAPATTTTTVTQPAAPASILHKVAGMLQGKGELVSKIASLEGALAQRDQAITELQGTILQQTKKLEGMAELEGLVKKLEGEQTSTSAAAANIVASLGFDANRLPGAQDSNADQDGPTSAADFLQQHSKLSSERKSDEAAKFYAKYAPKFGYA